MATILNKPSMIPLANPTVPLADTLNASVAKIQADTINRGKKAKKNKHKKANKHQATTTTTAVVDVVEVPADQVTVEAVKVKDEIVLPEVKTSSVIIAHTAEKEATKAAMPDEAMQGMIADFNGMKNEILAAHRNGAILPEGFAKAVREIADTLDAVEQVDSKKRGLSLNKHVYGAKYHEPKYDIRELDFCPKILDSMFKGDKYVKCFIPLHDFAVDSGKIAKSIYSSSGRSLLQIISDNMKYISDTEISTTDLGSEVTGINSNISRSGFLLYDTDKELDYIELSPWRFSYFCVEMAIPRKLYFETVAQMPEVTVCFSERKSLIMRRFMAGCLPSPNGNLISDMVAYNAVDEEDLKDISDLRKIKTHALSFEDIEALVHDPNVLIGGLISSNPKIINDIGRVYPRAVAPDGNIIMCDDEYFNPIIAR